MENTIESFIIIVLKIKPINVLLEKEYYIQNAELVSKKVSTFRHGEFVII